MPEYLAPGVYVEEIDTGSKPIEGVSTSTAAMVGFTERGPVDVPILLTSYGDYTRWFGGKLPPVDFPLHYYLPYAVEGFFTNGGKRLYLTRVINTADATRARGALHDRGALGGADTVILRAAGELTGTLASPPLLYALDVSAIAVGDTLRIGDGSNAEYRDVVNVGTPANNTHVPLSFPLGLSHDIGAGNNVEEIARTALGGIGAFTLDQESQLADTAIIVSGAAGDITTLVGLANPLIEIGAPAVAEHRFAGTITQLTATTARVVLQGGGLAMAHAAATAVVVLDTAVAVLQASQLIPAAAAGDRLIYVNNRGGNLDTPGNLVVIDGASPARREVRRIGQLGRVELSTGAYEEYGGGSLVEHVTLADDIRSLSAAFAPGVTAINLTADATQLINPGSELRIGLGPTQEVVTVSAVNRAAAPHVVTVSALVNGHAGADPVVANFELTAASGAGSRVLTLANRVSLVVGDILRIGDAPEDEYVTVEGLPNRAAAGADPGAVLLTHPLARAHAAGTAAQRQVAGTGAIRPTVLALDLDAGATQMLVTHGTGYAVGNFVRVTTFTGERFHHRLSAAFAASAPAQVEVDRPLSAAHIAGSALVERNELLLVEALDLGSWGNRIRVSVVDEQPGVVSRTTLATVIDPLHVRLGSAAGVEAGTVLELLDPLADDAVVGDPLKVESIDRANSVLTLRAPGLSLAQQAAQVAAIGAGTRLGVRSREFRIEVRVLNRPDPARPSRNDQVLDSEIFRYLSMDPRHSRYAPRIVGDPAAPLRRADRRPEGESWYIRITDTAPTEDVRLGPETLTDLLPTGIRRPARHPIDRGDDSLATLGDAEYIGTDNVDPEMKTGLWTLTNVDEISILASPGRTGATLQNALISQCENLRYRVAVIDSPAPPGDSIPDVQNLRQRYDSKYAALYYPWLLIDDPFPVNLQSIGTLAVPPAGHVMGIYARTDIERGVHKAPANEVVRGVTGLRRIVNHAQQEILNPYPSNINVIRDFRPNNRSIRVWGGRILTSDPDWKYVNVRRLIIFIERSIDLGLQWVVFEPNAEPLWARVRRSISNFLTTVWRNGALEGTTREEAYFVTCDRTTMTQADIDNGRLICVIGVAPVKPAEFVIIRIGLWTAHAEE